MEYNRWHPDGLEELRQKFLPDFETRENERLVHPDLIVHHPGHDGPNHNLLVLEAKKGDVSPRARERDYRKLTGFLSVFQYRQAVFLEFDGRGGGTARRAFLARSYTSDLPATSQAAVRDPAGCPRRTPNTAAAGPSTPATGGEREISARKVGAYGVIVTGP
ncbi:hypothetical protein OG762_36185 [Streptomyces sp. NBC_01136]|uniref:hypothetical protein n=1 Tax=unclassified Streptomyces TaxID=2593676 RepID=UPI00324CF2AD|nr:hypothetical protein OG762_36185 [Streptomyces sp. NBC_01136]